MSGVFDLAELKKANLYDTMKINYGHGAISPKSVIIDPQNILTYIGARTKPSSLTHLILRHMSRACKPVAAIIKTRQNQVAKFCRIPRGKHDFGFKISLRDTDRSPTKEEAKRMKAIENFMMFTGWRYDPNRPDFETFTRAIIRDTLTLDAMAFEIVPDRKGDIAELVAVDAGLIKFVDTDSYEKNVVYDEKGRASRPVKFVQEYQGQVLAEYSAEELCYGIRNPRTDIDTNGYGFSELEELIETVTGLLYAEAYNSKYFSQGTVPQGLLSIVGKYDKETLEAFKRAWQAQVSGVVNAWKVPVLALEEGQGVNFVPFKASAKDMEFNLYLEFLVKEACAVYQIDPQEINFSTYGAGGAPMIQSGSQASEATKMSQDRGLIPLLTFYFNRLNYNVIWKMNPEFVIEPVGLNIEDEMSKIDMATKQISSFRTINEIRKESNLPPIKDAYGDIVLNPYAVTLYSQAQQAEQAQGGQGEEDELDFNSLFGSAEGEKKEEDAEAPEESRTDDKSKEKKESGVIERQKSTSDLEGDKGLEDEEDNGNTKEVNKLRKGVEYVDLEKVAKEDPIKFGQIIKSGKVNMVFIQNGCRVDITDDDVVVKDKKNKSEYRIVNGKQIDTDEFKKIATNKKVLAALFGAYNKYGSDTSTALNTMAHEMGFRDNLFGSDE